jgi:thiosulfate dehydrogenase [quinone] large subunit
MNLFQRSSLVAIRLSLGVMFFYAGVTKVLDPSWSAAGYLHGAKTFAFLYQWMLDPAIMPFINFLNAWGLTLLGISLVIGGLIRYSAYAGAALMFLYYLAALDFPYPNAHAFLVDEHIVYICALVALAAFDAGRIWGFDGWWVGHKMTKKG